MVSDMSNVFGPAVTEETLRHEGEILSLMQQWLDCIEPELNVVQVREEFHATRVRFEGRDNGELNVVTLINEMTDEQRYFIKTHSPVFSVASIFYKVLGAGEHIL